MKEKEVVYPIFLECLKFAQDIFWESLFKDLAYGKPPYGTYISKDFLCCNFRNKEFSYKIECEKKSAQTLYQDIFHLLKNNVGLQSSQDKINERLKIQSMQENIKESRQQQWSNIRKKNAKDLLIERHVISMKRMYSLTILQSRFLLSLIYIAILFKIVKMKNIKYSKGAIQSIDNFTFQPRAILVAKNLYSGHSRSSPSVGCGGGGGDDDGAGCSGADWDNLSSISNSTKVSAKVCIGQTEKRLMQTKWTKFLRTL
jgi:hypothetical protein